MWGLEKTIGSFTENAKSISAGSGASTQAIKGAADKYFTFELTGQEIQNSLTSNQLRIDLDCGFVDEGLFPLYSGYVEVDEVVISEITDNTSLPLASRDEKVYSYGFNGMERDDEVSGSGNSYTTQFRQYDPRLGRWFSIDPKANLLPFQSPYAGMDNVPTIKNDKKGDCTICDQLIKHGVIHDPGIFGRNSLNVMENTTVTDPAVYSPNFFMVSLMEVFVGAREITSISETITTSTLEFSETKDEVIITKVTEKTIIVLSGQEVVSINKVVTTQRTTIGTQKKSYGDGLGLDIEWVDLSSYNQSDSKPVLLNSISEGLAKHLKKTKELNKGAFKRNQDYAEEVKRSMDSENVFTLPEPTTTPSSGTNDSPKRGGGK